MASVTNILLDLSLLSSRGWIAKLCLEQDVASHGTETGIDLFELVMTDTIDGCEHVGVDSSPVDVSRHRKGTVAGCQTASHGFAADVPSDGMLGCD
jgi:hypothetical protein